MYDVTALGELLIDFAPAGTSEYGNGIYEANPGGAPANVLTSLSRQGKRTAFIGKVGSDAFGDILRKTLDVNGIDTRCLYTDSNARTTLAFVSLTHEGDRSFSFFRNPGADIMLKPEEIDEEVIQNSEILHFGSLSLTNEPARSATLRALELAKEHGVAISYDPNLRPPLWDSLDEAKRQILSCLPYADILKISEEEFQFLLGHMDYEEGSHALCMEYGITHLFVTLGAQGSFYRCGDVTVRMPAADVQVVDTTGSGDAFMGAALCRLGEREQGQFSALTEEEMQGILAYANASGSLTATKKGGIPAIPTRDEINACLGIS